MSQTIVLSGIFAAFRQSAAQSTCFIRTQRTNHTIGIPSEKSAVLIRVREKLVIIKPDVRGEKKNFQYRSGTGLTADLTHQSAKPPVVVHFPCGDGKLMTSKMHSNHGIGPLLTQEQCDHLI